MFHAVRRRVQLLASADLARNAIIKCFRPELQQVYLLFADSFLTESNLRSILDKWTEQWNNTEANMQHNGGCAFRRALFLFCRLTRTGADGNSYGSQGSCANQFRQFFTRRTADVANKLRSVQRNTALLDAIGALRNGKWVRCVGCWAPSPRRQDPCPSKPPAVRQINRFRAPPGAPLGLAATAPGVGVQLTWMPPRTFGSAVASYEVQRAPTAAALMSGAGTALPTATAASALDPAPLSGGAFYRVRSVDTTGAKGAWSLPVEVAATAPPGVPTPPGQAPTPTVPPGCQQLITKCQQQCADKEVLACACADNRAVSQCLEPAPPTPQGQAPTPAFVPPCPDLLLACQAECGQRALLSCQCNPSLGQPIVECLGFAGSPVGPGVPTPNNAPVFFGSSPEAPGGVSSLLIAL